MAILMRTHSIHASYAPDFIYTRRRTIMSTTELEKRDWIGLEQKYYQGTFKRQPVTLVRGEGTRVWDSDGKVYLDFVAGIAVNVLGHCHPAIVQAVKQQGTPLVHLSNLYYKTPPNELARLVGVQGKRG